MKQYLVNIVLGHEGSYKAKGQLKKDSVTVFEGWNLNFFLKKKKSLNL